MTKKERERERRRLWLERQHAPRPIEEDPEEDDELKPIKVTVVLEHSKATGLLWYWYDLPGTTYHIAGSGKDEKEARADFGNTYERLRKFLRKKGELIKFEFTYKAK